MKTTRTTAVALLALTALAVPAPAGAAQPRDAADTSTTSEQDCYEHATAKNTDYAPVVARLPQGWDVSRSATTGRTTTRFIDFTCEDWSVDGRPGRRTTTTMVIAFARPTGMTTGPSTIFVLEHGSDNPHYVHALRRLGVRSQYLPETTAEYTVREDGGVDYTQSFVGADEGPDLDHSRTVSAPPVGPYAASTATYHFPTDDGGVVQVVYSNLASAPVQAAMPAEDMGAGSRLLDVYRMGSPRNVPAGPAVTFLRGSWTSTITRLDTP